MDLGLCLLLDFAGRVLVKAEIGRRLRTINLLQRCLQVELQAALATVHRCRVLAVTFLSFALGKVVAGEGLQQPLHALVPLALPEGSLDVVADADLAR